MSQERQYPIYLFLLCAALFLPGLGLRDFWAPVEPRYAEIVRVMYSDGEWVVPTVNGDLYTDKPILYFWLALIASYAVGAVNEWTVRLPAALGGMGFVLATFFIGRDLFNARVGWIAGAILATSARVIWEARWAHIDALFCFFFVLSVYYAARVLLRKGHRFELLAAYAFMGLATLSKGLIGIVLPGLLLVAFAIGRRDWATLRDFRLHLAGAAVFLAIVAPWLFLISAATDGKWLADFLYIHHFERYTAGTGHRQPIYYYLITLPADFAPWTIFLIPALVVYPRYRESVKDPATLLLILWFSVVFVFFTASDTKRDLYLMPLLPTLAIFLGRYLDDLAAGLLRPGGLYRWIALPFFVLVAFSGLTVPFGARILLPEVFMMSFSAAAALAVTGGLAAFYAWRDRPLRVVAATALMMTLMTLTAAIWGLPFTDRFKSRKPLSLEIRRIVPSEATLYIYGDEMNDFNYYTGRRVIPVIDSPEGLKKLLAVAENDYMLIKERELKKAGVLPKGAIVATDNVGSSRWHLIALSSAANELRVLR